MRTIPLVHIFTLSLGTLLLISGCFSQTRNIEGQVFIVTEGKDNIKLGLVTIGVYKTDIAQSALLTTIPALKQISSQNEDREEKYRQLIEAAQSHENDVSYAVDKLIKIDEEALDAYDRASKDTTLDEDTLTKYELAWRKAQHNAENKQDESNEAIAETKNIQKKAKDWEESVQFPAGIIMTAVQPLAPIAEAKTDADGKFHLSGLPLNVPVVAIAASSRKVADKTETYFWLVPITPTDTMLTLSNDNLIQDASLFEEIVNPNK